MPRGTGVAVMRFRLMPSTAIRFFRYAPETRDLDVLFTTGRRYVYRDVPEETYDAMKEASSKGEFFNLHIRDHFTFERNSDVPSAGLS